MSGRSAVQYQVSPRRPVGLDAIRNRCSGRLCVRRCCAHWPPRPARTCCSVNMRGLAGAMHAFHAATEERGEADRVTTFTASDFGRTLTGTDESDHGWGGTQLALGHLQHLRPKQGLGHAKQRQPLRGCDAAPVDRWECRGLPDVQQPRHVGVHIHQQGLCRSKRFGGGQHRQVLLVNQRPGQVTAALFQIKNTTSNDVVWTPNFYATSYGAWGGNASIFHANHSQGQPGQQCCFHLDGRCRAWIRCSQQSAPF